MRRKQFFDMVICCLAIAIAILSYTYIEQIIVKRVMLSFCVLVLCICIVCLMKHLKKTKRKINKGSKIHVLELLDEDGKTITTWNIGGKTAVLIGRDTFKENVDINLQNTAYGGMVDRQHAVLNYAGSCWYIEDLNSKNGIRIQNRRDGKIYKISDSHPCQINKGDIIYVGKTQLKAN